MDIAAADTVFLLGQHHDRAAFRRLVGERSELRGVRQLLLAHTAHGHEGCRLPVAEGDGAGLVEQQRIDVAGGFDGAAGHGEHVEPHQAVHAGDADGRQQRADGGRNERHEQRHDHHDGDRATGVGGEARYGRRGEHEDDGHARKENVERDLVRRLLTLGAFDQLDHAVEEGRALRCGDAHLEPVGDHQRAAGHGRAIAAGFANDRRGFAGNRRLVHRGDAFDHLAVGRNQIAGFDQHHLSRPELAGRSGHHECVFPIDDELRLGLLAGLPQACGLRLAAAFRHRLGEIGKEHGEPQPDHDLEGEAEMVGSVHPVADEKDGGERRHHLDHEHHRILHHGAWIELGEGRADGGQDDLGIGQRRDRHPFAQLRGFH